MHPLQREVERYGADGSDLFVIVARPQEQTGTGTYYIAKDTTVTKRSWQAAAFDSYADAKQFAAENQIASNASTYISMENITDLEFHIQEPFDNSGRITRNLS